MLPRTGDGEDEESTVKYLMLVCVDPTGEPVENSTGDASAMDWVTEMDSRGVRVLGERVRPPGDAVAVRVRGGELRVTKGPFAETTEHIAGFDVLECADLEEAIEVAGRHPMARYGALELREFWAD